MQQPVDDACLAACAERSTHSWYGLLADLREWRAYARDVMFEKAFIVVVLVGFPKPNDVGVGEFARLGVPVVVRAVEEHADVERELALIGPRDGQRLRADDGGGFGDGFEFAHWWTP